MVWYLSEMEKNHVVFSGTVILRTHQSIFNINDVYVPCVMYAWFNIQKWILEKFWRSILELEWLGVGWRGSCYNLPTYSTHLLISSNYNHHHCHPHYHHHCHHHYNHHCHPHYHPLPSHRNDNCVSNLKQFSFCILWETRANLRPRREVRIVRQGSWDEVHSC